MPPDDEAKAGDSASGKDVFNFSLDADGGDEVALARAQGLPVVYIAAVYQQYPIAIFAPKGKGLTDAQSLTKLKVGLPGKFGSTYIGYKAILYANKIDESNVNAVEIGFTQAQSVQQGKVDAADVVQESFLGAYRAFAQFRGTTEAGLLAGLRQVLACGLANLVRHDQGTQRRDIRLERQLAVEIDQSSHALDRGLMAATSSPSQQAIRREQSVLLAEALARLPDDWRDLLILRHLEGLTFPEVAERLGRTLDSVKKQWPRALAKLRRLLEGESS